MTEQKLYNKKKAEAQIRIEEMIKKSEAIIQAGRTNNDAARRRLLGEAYEELSCNLRICEILGWDKLEFLIDLQRMLKPELEDN